MARADARANEHLARRAQEGAEAAPVVSSSTGGPSSSAAGRSGPFLPQGGQGMRVAPASAGAEPH
eukprot:13145864-Alexandrium_andersonii.AAC.1